MNVPSALPLNLTRLWPRTLRAQLALAFLVPSLLALTGLSSLAFFAARSLVEDELGHRLSDIAATTAANLNAGLIARFEPENLRTHENLQRRLLRVTEQVGARRIFIVTLEGNALVDSSPQAPPPGSPDRSLAEDRFELDQVAEGRRTASVLYASAEGVRYLRGYAPVTYEGQVIAALGVEASSDGFDGLDALRNYSIGLTLLSLMVLAIGMLLFARALSAPLARLAKAAAQIGAGDLHASVPTLNPTTEVAVLAQTMEEMRAALLQREREQQLMLGGIAHEIRNPLGGMSLFVGLLAEDLADRPEERALLSRVERELGQLTRIVEEFLQYSRQAPIQRETIDLQAIVREVAESAGLSPQWLTTPPSPEGGPRGDTEQLRRVLLNLAHNAAQAGAQQWTCTALPGGLSVRDDGPGVPLDKAELIFDAFFTEKQQGTGLGLALSRRIAHAHGGSLTLDNPGEAGAQFTLLFDSSST